MHPLCKIAMSQCFNLPVFGVHLSAQFSHAHGVYVYLCRWMRLNAPAIRCAVNAVRPTVIPQWSAACTHPFIIIVWEYHPMDHEPIRIMHPTMLFFTGLRQISVGVSWTHRGGHDFVDLVGRWRHAADIHRFFKTHHIWDRSGRSSRHVLVDGFRGDVGMEVSQRNLPCTELFLLVGPVLPNGTATWLIYPCVLVAKGTHSVSEKSRMGGEDPETILMAIQRWYTLRQESPSVFINWVRIMDHRSLEIVQAMQLVARAMQGTRDAVGRSPSVWVCVDM